MSKAASLAQRWRALAAYIDGRNPRERILLFLVALAAVYFLCHFALFRPLFAYEAKLRERLGLNQTQLATLQQQTLDMLAKVQQDPDLPNRTRLEALTRQLDEIDAPMAELMRSLVPPQEMTALVQALLAAGRGVRVVSVEHLPPEAVEAGAPEAAAPQEDKPRAAAALYKHGLRITVQGGFHDILGFFAGLEQLSWKVLWDEADIKTERYPVSTAEVTVYTLSTDESWIRL